MSFERVVPGITGRVTMVVGEADTAKHLGSGSVQVLATPRMVLLVEQAGVAAVDHLLPEGYRTVGTRVNVSHNAPTPLGFEVEALAELHEVDGRRLVFHVVVNDASVGGGDSMGKLVGEGTHERFIVNVQRFSERVAKRRV